ncbi:MAG TPA: DUF4446 family protein [Desulfitobacteriaceae bacterium]|nr:DUF4446 family protein [Desulfitobacteriaceae bacterium]
MSTFLGVSPLVEGSLLGLLAAVLILLFVTVTLFNRLSRKIKKHEAAHIALQTCLSGKSLDASLEEYLKSVEIMKDQIMACSLRLDKIERKLRLAADRVEMVRFSAFEDMGSELSFAVAMLNQDGNGVVLSSINNRVDTRMYAKPVIGGKSNHNLSNEEIEVITKAQTGEKI